jgi:hypothetical protein
MQDNSPTITPKAYTRKSRINSARLKLLTYIEKENEIYLQRSDIQFNSKKPVEIMRKYSIIRIKRSHTSNNKLKDTCKKISGGSKEFLKEEKAIFTKFMQEIGKDFIDLRKKDVGVKKMEKIKKLTIDTNLSFVEAFNNISSRKRSNTFRFSYVNLKQKLEELFMSKEEKDAKYIQDNFNKIQDMVRLFKKTPSKDFTNFKDSNTNFIKFSGELFDILEFKGIKFDPKVISADLKRNRGSYDIPRNPFAKCEKPELKHKSNSIINVTEEAITFRKFKTFRNLDYDNVETNVNTMGNSPIIRFNKRKEEDFIEDIIDDNYNDLLSPFHINYEKNGPIENYSDIEAENRISNLYDEECSTPINFKTPCQGNYVNLIRCNRPSVFRCDSAEVSKFSEVTKSDISRTCSISRDPSVSCDSISEVSNDFEYEMNNSCS